MWNNYTQNGTILSAFLNANIKDDLTYYHWTSNLKIIGHTEINIEY